MHFSRFWKFLCTSTNKNRSRQIRRHRRLAFEILEDRAVPTATASGIVSGVAFIDKNGDGIQQSTEPILPGASIILTGTTTQTTAPNSTHVNSTVVTDANGAFRFINVLPGNYQLSTGSVPGLVTTGVSFGGVSSSQGINLAIPTPLNATKSVGIQGSVDLSNIGIILFLNTTTQSSLFLASAGNGQTVVNNRENSLPTIPTAFADVTAQQGTSTTIDLAGHFTDPDYLNTRVTFHLTANGVAKSIAVDLFDSAAPQAVANFLSYVQAHAYDSSIFNRMVTSGGISILQGGGSKFDASAATHLTLIPQNAPVANEYSASIPNSAFTLAAARTSDLNSATDEFYFNLADNSTALPNFTVFGRVADATSQAVLTTLAQIQHDQTVNSQNSSAAAAANPGVDFGNVPLVGYSGSNFASDTTASNFIILNGVSIDHQTEKLTYTVNVTPNNGLVTATVTDERLKLIYAANQTGSVQVTVTATDAFGATTTSPPFTVNVDTAPVITSAPVTLNQSSLSVAPVAQANNSNPVTFTYQWLRNGVAISQATSQTLDLAAQLTAGHVSVGDKFSVRVTPSETNAGTGPVFTSPNVTITSTSPFAIANGDSPEVISAPVTLESDQTHLSVAPTANAVNANPVTFTYQWLHNGVPIPNETNATLDLTGASVGTVNVDDTFAVSVTPSEQDAPPGNAFISPSVRISATNPFAINGLTTPVVTAAPVTLDPDLIHLNVAPVATGVNSNPVTFTYQWLLGSLPIANATNSSLDLTSLPGGPVNVNDKFSVVVTPSESGAGSGPEFRTPDVLITATNPISITADAAPAVESASVTLTDDHNHLTVHPVASAVNVNPVTFTYQWFQNDVAVPNANSQTLDLTTIGQVSIGDKFKVQITPSEDAAPSGVAFTSGFVTITGTNPFTIQ